MASLSERIANLRKRVQRRESAKRAKRRAKARRIEKEEPKGKTEAVQVKAKQAKQEAKETKAEASGLAEDAKELIATELGTENPGKVISQASEFVSANPDTLDFDGDGDSDILTQLDQPLPNEEPEGFGFGEEVMDFSETDPNEIDMSQPSPGEIRF